MAQRILGLDLGAHAVKAVLLESTYRGYTIADHAIVPVPPAPAGEEATPLLARQVAVVQSILAGRGWSVDDALVAVPGAALASHAITLPFTDPRRIEQTIGYEVEAQIPFELAEVAWDWQPLVAAEGKTHLYVGVVRQEEMAALLAGLAQAGVDPRVVVPAGPAYASLAATGALAPLPPPVPAEAGEAGPPAEAAVPAAPVDDDAVEAVLDLGEERTAVSVLGPDGCEAARTFGFGVGQLRRALARDLALTAPAAAALLAGLAGDPGAPESAAVLATDPRCAEAVRRGLAPLARELRATLRAWHARAGARPVARLVLCGGLARLPALAELLAPEVNGPVVPLALAGPAAGVIDPAEVPSLALALALALRGHQGSRAPRVNLRRGAFAFTRDFEHLKGRVERLAVYAALLLLLAVASAGVKVFALSRQEALLDRALCDAQQKILGKCYGNFEEAQSILRGRGAAGAALPKVSAVEIFGELSERVPAEVPVRFDRIEITRDKVHLEGTTDAAENVDRIVTSLRGSRCFGDARSGSARKRASDGKFEFSVDAGLTCLESGPRAPAGGRG